MPILKLIADAALIAWVALSFGVFIPGDEWLYGAQVWEAQTHQLIAQICIALCVIGFLHFSVFPFTQARRTGRYIPLLVLRPLVWIALCVGAYAYVAPQPGIIAYGMNKAMQMRGYTVLTKRESIAKEDTPYTFYGHIPLTYYTLYYRLESPGTRKKK